MSGLEIGNKSIRARVALLLRSRLAGIASLPHRSRLRLTLAGAAALAAVPVAAFAVQGLSGSSDTGASVSSQPAADSLPVQAGAALNQDTASNSSSSSSSAGSSENHATVNTQVTVNGQSVPVPENGSVHRIIETGNGGQVTVDINNSTTTENNPGNSFTSVHSFSSSTSSSVNVNQTTNIGGISQ